MKVALDITGHRFGNWTALEHAGFIANKKPKIHRWLCKCDCGIQRIVRKSSLTCGETKHCGCQTAKIVAAAVKTHGLRNHSAYPSWAAMIQRCTNPTHKNYTAYGGSGKTVCERWLSLVNFCHDMGERPVGMTIERINNELGYSPENCRWATRQEQSRNKLVCRKYLHDGKEKTIYELSLESGIRQKSLRLRLARGWSVDEAISHPLNGGRRPAKVAIK